MQKEIDALRMRVAELEGAIRKVVEDGVQARTTPYRQDGKPSKHDKCSHDLYMWEGCEQCVCDYLSAVLKPSASK